MLFDEEDEGLIPNTIEERKSQELSDSVKTLDSVKPVEVQEETTEEIDPAMKRKVFSSADVRSEK